MGSPIVATLTSIVSVAAMQSSLGKRGSGPRQILPILGRYAPAWLPLKIVNIL
jgi:hypothetical protein